MGLGLGLGVGAGVEARSEQVQAEHVVSARVDEVEAQLRQVRLGK